MASPLGSTYISKEKMMAWYLLVQCMHVLLKYVQDGFLSVG
jgi:hypothetical protein